jgi:hypothetical protein
MESFGLIKNWSKRTESGWCNINIMLSATDLKNGTAFIYYSKPYQVIKYSLIKMGRGGAVVKVLVLILLLMKPILLRGTYSSSTRMLLMPFLWTPKIMNK